jgi:hypothetical protein
MSALLSLNGVYGTELTFELRPYIIYLLVPPTILIDSISYLGLNGRDFFFEDNIKRVLILLLIKIILNGQINYRYEYDILFQ